jgi:hypothetical protein
MSRKKKIEKRKKEKKERKKGRNPHILFITSNKK